MADTDALRPYKRSSTPVIPGGEARYQSDELKKIETVVASIVNVMKKLEARLVAGGL